jgi:hypothetical protein
VSRAARARAWTRHLLLERAHDATDLVAGRSLLVLAPHPDDETLGCAGRIQRAVATGAAVTIVVATDGGRSHDLDPIERDELRALRRSELVAACACLGVPETDVITLDFADGELAHAADELAVELETLLRRLSPDDVCVTCARDCGTTPGRGGPARRCDVGHQARCPRLLQQPARRIVGRPRGDHAPDRRPRPGARRLRALLPDDPAVAPGTTMNGGRG